MCKPTECRYLSEASHVLLALGAGGAIRAVDPRSPTPLGYEADSLTGKPLAEVVAREHRDHLARILTRMKHTASVWEPVTFLTAEGRPVPMLCCFQRLRGGDAPRHAILVSGMKLDSIEADLRSEAAVALGNVAFQCHSPAHRLMQAVEATVARHPTCEAARRCRDDLDGLLDALSRSAAWPDELAGRRPVEVIRLLEETLRFVDASGEFEPLKVTLRPECPTAWADVHPAGLAFVALHLVANARDAVADVQAPRLFVDVNADGDQVAVEFQDNGPGLDHEDLGCAFAPMFSKGAHKAGHTGAGLATCCQLVQAMGGRIHMQSRRDLGTTVIVNLQSATPPA